jgi:hypothetical protein
MQARVEERAHSVKEKEAGVAVTSAMVRDLQLTVPS